MRKITTVLVATAFIAFTSISGMALAAEHPEPMDRPAGSAAPMDPAAAQMDRTQDFGHWIGKDVRNPSGEDLGDVRDFVRDEDGRISLVVLSHGGFLGLGEKRVAVPFSALTHDQNQDHLVLDATKEQVENAPRVADDLNLADRTYAEEVYRHFGQRPYWTEQTPAAGAGDVQEMNRGEMDQGTTTPPAESPPAEGSTR